MYVCNCNGLTVTDVVKACTGDLKTPFDVFSYFYVEECCGKCVPELEEYLLNSKKT